MYDHIEWVRMMPFEVWWGIEKHYTPGCEITRTFRLSAVMPVLGAAVKEARETGLGIAVFDSADGRGQLAAFVERDEYIVGDVSVDIYSEDMSYVGSNVLGSYYPMASVGECIGCYNDSHYGHSDAWDHVCVDYAEHPDNETLGCVHKAYMKARLQAQKAAVSE